MRLRLDRRHSIDKRKVDGVLQALFHRAPTVEPDYKELVPLLYPNYSSRYRAISRMALEYLNTLVLQKNMLLYKRSQYDVNNYDFNFYCKLPYFNENLNSTYLITKKLYSVESLVSRFIKAEKLEGVANLSISNTIVPPRIINKYDCNTILALLGSLLLKSKPFDLNDPLNIAINERLLNVKKE